MEIDMSPEAVTNRLQTMEQLWELSVNLMQAQELSETALLSEKSFEKEWNNPQEDKAWQYVKNIPTID